MGRSRFGADFADDGGDSEILRPQLLPGVGNPPQSNILHGWSKNGRLIMRNPTQVLTMQADFPEPGNYTIQFGIVPKTPFPPVLFGQRSKAEALIKWSVEGNDLTRRVTLANGLSITGMGQAASVRIFDTTVGGPAFDPAFDPSYPVSVQVVKGTRPSVQQPPTLIPFDPNGSWTNGHILVNPGDSPILIIPDDAGAISAQVTIEDSLGAVIPAGAVTVIQRTGGVKIKEYDPRDYDWVPLSAAAEEILIHNYTAGQVFVNLTYGIDG